MRATCKVCVGAMNMDVRGNGAGEYACREGPAGPPYLRARSQRNRRKGGESDYNVPARPGCNSSSREIRVSIRLSCELPNSARDPDADVRCDIRGRGGVVAH